jgi:chitinase
MIGSSAEGQQDRMRQPPLLSKVSLGALLLALAGACDGGSTNGARTGGAAGSTTGAAGASAGTGGPSAGSNGAAGNPGAGGAASGAAGSGAGTAGGSGTGGATAGAAGSTAGTSGTNGAAGAAGSAGARGTAGSGAGGSGTAGAAGSAGIKGTAGSMGGASGGGGNSAGAGASGSSPFPARLAAPYVETWGNASLTDLATATGNKYYTLAFIISGGNCAPTWNGDTAIADDTHWSTQIASLRKAGGDVLISFGGASGTELGDDCNTVETLQTAYQSVITRYGLKWMDLDIESGAESKTADIDRRNKALKNLQDANPGLKVSYTLGVDPSGLPSAQRNVLANAKTNGVRVDDVNIMAMDYGACNIDMGQAAIMAATATHTQIQTLGTTSLVGVTPMIGVNDVTCETFTTANATALETFAAANDYINLLAFWAIGADKNHAYLNIFTMLR